MTNNNKNTKKELTEKRIREIVRDEISIIETEKRNELYSRDFASPFQKHRRANKRKTNQGV